MQCCVMGRMYEVESGTCPYGRHGRHCSGLIFFLNPEVETHKAPFHLHPFWFGVWFEGFSRLARNNKSGAALSAMVVLVRNNKARPCTAQGHSQAVTSYAHTHANADQLALPNHTRSNANTHHHTLTNAHSRQDARQRATTHHQASTEPPLTVLGPRKLARSRKPRVSRLE